MTEYENAGEVLGRNIVKIFSHLSDLDARGLENEDMIFVTRLKRFVMNQAHDIPDYLKVEGLETLDFNDMAHSGFEKGKFRFDLVNYSWYPKSRSKTVVENEENRQTVRRFFEKDSNTVFSDRSGVGLL